MMPGPPSWHHPLQGCLGVLSCALIRSLPLLALTFPAPIDDCVPGPAASLLLTENLHKDSCARAAVAWSPHWSLTGL